MTHTDENNNRPHGGDGQESQQVCDMLKRSVKTVTISFNADKATNATMSRLSDFSKLACKFGSIGWLGTLTVAFQNNDVRMGHQDVNVLNSEYGEFIQNKDVLYKALKSLSLLDTKGFAITIVISAKICN